MHFSTPHNVLSPTFDSSSSYPSPSSSPIKPTSSRPNTDVASFLASLSVPSESRPATSSTNNSPSSISKPNHGRTLGYNPNGTLWYLGGGSCRRYPPPVFDTPPRKKVVFPRGFGEGRGASSGVSRIAETPSPSDGKRRRLGTEPDLSTAQASDLNPTTINGIGSSTGESQSAPTTANGPPFGTSFGAGFMTSTSTRPSPLRQSVRADSSSTGSASASGVSPRVRFADAGGEGRERASERASEIMAGIINDATPNKVHSLRYIFSCRYYHHAEIYVFLL